MHRRVDIVASFEEAAIRHISDYAQRRSVRGRYWALDTGSLRRLDRFSGSRRGRSMRDSNSAAEPIGILANLVRVAAARRKSVASHFWGNYAWRPMLGSAAAKAYRRAEIGDVLIAMPGSAYELFQSAEGHDVLRALHVVDSLPWARNQAILSHHSRREARSELYPQRMIEVVKQELAVSDVVIVPSQYVANQAVAAGVPDAKVAVVPYGGADERASSVGAGVHVPSEESLSDERPRVVFAGQISLRKGIPSLLAAVTQAPNVDLILAGPAYDRSLLKTLPGSTSYVGQLVPAALRHLMSSADAFILPSLDDSFGLVATEAASLGSRIVISDHCGAAEVLPQAQVFKAGDVAMLANILQGISRDTGERRNARKASFERQISYDAQWDRFSAEVLRRLGLQT